MAIKYLTYEIASRCNMDCGFCFSDWRDQSAELDTEQAKKAIQLMCENGLQAINLTGGEPLLRRDIAEILKFAKDLGLTTILTTNGILLERRIEEILGGVDFVGLPFDSDRESVHNHLRPTNATNNHYRLVIALMGMLNINYPAIGVKLNTVVTQENADSILGIGEIVSGKIISWKLSQFIPSGFGEQHKNQYAISKQDYMTIVEKCRKAYPTINILSSVAHERDDCCRIISPNGHLLRPIEGRLVDLGCLDALTYQVALQGFNQPKNEQVLGKTYLRVKNER